MEPCGALRMHKQTFLGMFEQFRAPCGLYLNILTSLKIGPSHGWTDRLKNCFEHRMVDRRTDSAEKHPAYSCKAFSFTRTSLRFLYFKLPVTRGHRGYLPMPTGGLGGCRLLSSLYNITRRIHFSIHFSIQFRFKNIFGPKVYSV